MKISLKQKILATATAAALVGGTGAAVAYWTSTGSGTGSAGVGTSTTWEVTTNASTGTGSLTPDGPIRNVVINVKNNSSGVQGLQSLVVKVANADGTPWTAVAGCAASDFKLGTALAGADYTITKSPVLNVAAGATHSGDSVDIQMVNKTTTNQDGCKNATVPLHVSAS